MKRKRKLTRKDFEPSPTPVWTTSGAEIKPTPFFQNWWQSVAEQECGDRERWLDAAIQLGYVWRYREPNTGEIHHDPIGFDYDPVLCRNSLNIPEDMPLVRQDDSKHDEYKRVWKILLSEGAEGRNNGY